MSDPSMETIDILRKKIADYKSALRIFYLFVDIAHPLNEEEKKEVRKMFEKHNVSDVLDLIESDSKVGH